MLSSQSTLPVRKTFQQTRHFISTPQQHVTGVPNPTPEPLQETVSLSASVHLRTTSLIETCREKEEKRGGGGKLSTKLTSPIRVLGGPVPLGYVGGPRRLNLQAAPQTIVRRRGYALRPIDLNSERLRRRGRPSRRGRTQSSTSNGVPTTSKRKRRAKTMDNRSDRVIN